MSNSPFLPIDWTLSGAATSGQSWQENDGNERVLHIPQSSNVTEVSPSDNTLGES